MTFSSPNPDKVRIGEVDIILPDMPDESMMINFDKPELDQKFKPYELTKDMRAWNEFDLDKFAEMQWHRRIHGEWVLIKGQPFYFPGGCLPFFDFWTTHKGKRPAFRMEAWEFFMFWYMFIERDDNLFGMYDMKCRRLGDTEKVMYILWERTTRFKGATAGLQSYTDEEAKGNFGRLARGARGMPYFFKPNRSGSDRDFLAFMSPSQVMTEKKLKNNTTIDLGEALEESDYLGSYVDYEATVTGKYDGRQLFTYNLDEIFKIKPHQLNVKEQWNNVKKVQSLNNEMAIFGKSILCSTVEEKTKDADKKGIESTVEVAEYFWDNSDPNDRDEFGRTYTGLARIFRGYTNAAPIDEWGFHKKEEARKFRDAKLQKYREKGDFQQVIDLYRKEPASPEEALTQSSDKCPLFPEVMHARMNQIKHGLDRWDKPIEGYQPKVVEGELVWRNGIPNTEVQFVPKAGGKWHISQMPIMPNNVQMRQARYTDEFGEIRMGNIFMPMNSARYCSGCDPYDSDIVVGQGSDGAFSIKRRLYLPDEEKEIRMDETGRIVNVEDMITNTYVCDYKYRHKNPQMFYNDYLKTLWFYGCSGFVELDKPGLSLWMKRKFYSGFLTWEPGSLLSSTSRRKPRQGVKATAEVVNAYVEKLVIYTSQFVWNQHHPRILKSWSRFIPAKRTKFDLSVATGLTELADDTQRYGLKKDVKSGWTNSPFPTV